MTQLQITDALTPLTENIIDNFEEQLGINLPRSYRSFLIQHNGGHPEPNMFPIRDFYADTHGLLEWFFCIAEGDVYDLGYNKYLYRDRVPSDLLPIAVDPGGNLICLAIKGHYYGKVYFWHHEDEGEDIATYNNVYLVADNFDDLLKSLTIVSSES